MFLPIHDDNPLRRFPIYTFLIIAINLIAFLWLLQLDPHMQRVVAAKHGFVPARFAQLWTNLPVVVNLYPEGNVDRPDRFLTIPAHKGAVILSLITCMFLHGSWMHLIGNMWFFWVFGNNVEDRLGRLIFPLFYLLGGILATACHWLVARGAGHIPVIGASGAVAVMLGAYAVTYPLAKIRTLVFLVVFITIMELPAALVLGVWLVFQLLDGVGALRLGIDGGVAWWAHIGGFVSGMVLMPLLSAGTAEPEDWRNEKQPEHRYLDSK